MIEPLPPSFSKQADVVFACEWMLRASSYGAKPRVLITFNVRDSQHRMFIQDHPQLRSAIKRALWYIGRCSVIMQPTAFRQECDRLRSLGLVRRVKLPNGVKLEHGSHRITDCIELTPEGHARLRALKIAHEIAEWP